MADGPCPRTPRQPHSFLTFRLSHPDHPPAVSSRSLTGAGLLEGGLAVRWTSPTLGPIPQPLSRRPCRHTDRGIPPKHITLAVKCSDSAEDIRHEAPRPPELTSSRRILFTSTLFRVRSHQRCAHTPGTYARRGPQGPQNVTPARRGSEPPPPHTADNSDGTGRARRVLGSPVCPSTPSARPPSAHELALARVPHPGGPPSPAVGQGAPVFSTRPHRRSWSRGPGSCWSGGGASVAHKSRTWHGRRRGGQMREQEEEDGACL